MSGGIPALANLREWIPQVAQPVTAMPEGDLELPVLLRSVRSLGEVVEVDYWIPGCPPESRQVWSVLKALIEGAPLPARGSVLGGGVTSVCEECAREKGEKRIAKFLRPYEVVPDERRCLLEQGIVCMGVATRNGCGALCPAVNMPCTGCYGPADGIADQGAKVIAALGSALDTGEYKGMGESQLVARADEAAAALADSVGTLYRYTLAGAALWRNR
jgi:F420-non-reducing hydrogenase small subunit